MPKGSLEVICGSMFSGKTEELIRRLRRAEYAKLNVLTIRHGWDKRYSYTCIVSHDGGRRVAYALEGEGEKVDSLVKLAENYQVIGIDEAQFFPEETIPVLEELLEKGKRVILSGLDMDFRGEPFGPMPTLMAMADSVTKLRAICLNCGNEANFTQRLVDGKPASYDDPTVSIGAKECYEARCRSCYQGYKKAGEKVASASA